MNKEDFKIRAKVIREAFDDTRAIKCPTPETVSQLDEDIHQGGDLFTTEDGEFIDLEFQMNDFDERELAKYVEFAEALYEKHERRVSIYIICPKDVNVSVRECEIKSRADFIIRLACIGEDPCKIVLNAIKNKLRDGEMLDGDDLYALSMLHVMCNPKDRKYYLIEYFKIINELF